MYTAISKFSNTGILDGIVVKEQKVSSSNSLNANTPNGLNTLNTTLFEFAA